MEPSVKFRKQLKSVALVLSVVCLWGSLSACSDPEENKKLDPSAQKYLSFIGVGESPNAKKQVHRRGATQRAFDSSSAPTNTEIAPFFGNLTVVTQPPTAAVDSYDIVWRQANCSLSFANYTIGLSAQNQFEITPAEYLPGYEKTIHNNAFLTTTPDIFANGCIDNKLGIESSFFVVAGPYKAGTEMLATLGPSGVITGAIDGYESYIGPTNLATDYPPTAVVSGDLNKDGYPDVVSVNTDGEHASLTVFLGNSDGTFTPGATLALPGNAANYAVIDDVNGDGNLDIVSVSPNSTETFSVFLGNGDGTFQPIQNVLIPGSTLSFNNAFVTTDVNGDGKKDIVATNGEIFLGKGDGITFTLVSQTAFGNMDSNSSIVAADFNNDGKIDLVTDDTSVIRTYKGNGDGTFTAGPTYPTIADMGFIHATDLDGDGNLDIWSGYAGDTVYMGSQVSTGYALMGNGDGTFQGVPNLSFVYNGSNMADLNGDGRPDFAGVVTGSFPQVIQTYLTGANGIPVAGPTQNVANANGIDSLALGDVTGDHVPDLIYLSSAPQIQSFYVAAGNGDGSFQAPTVTPTPSLVPSGIDINEAIFGIRLADMNHDGKLDLVYSFSDQDSQGAQLYYEGFAVQLGNGDGTFKAPQIVYTYQNASPPTVFPSNILNAIEDVTGDNIPDVFMVLPGPIVDSTAQSTVEDFVGNGDGTFKAPNTLTVTPNLRSSDQSINEGSPFAFGDVNGDGKMDLITAGSSVDGMTPQIAISLGNGDGTFKAPTTMILGGFGFANSPAIADFDGDGKLDLATSGGVFPGNGDGTFQSFSNGDGTVTGALTIYPQAAGDAVTADLNNDGKPDLVIGSAIFLSKFGAVPPVLATTTTALTSSLNPSTAGASVTFTATVISATAGTITGTVTFLDGSTSIGTGTVGAGGVATLASSTLTQGSHSITASYGGDSNYGTSVSPAVTQVVNGATTVSTSTALSASSSDAASGTNITFTATVTASAAAKKSAAAPAITGTVTFFDGTTSLGTGSVGAAGVATLSTTTLAVGAHSITASYGGDSNYATSVSTAVSVTITAAAGTFTVAANPSSITVTKSTPGATTITVTPSGGFTQTVTFSCANLPANYGCSFAPPAVTPDGAPVTTMLTVTDGVTPTRAAGRKSAAGWWPLANDAGDAGGPGRGAARHSGFATPVATIAFGGELALFALLLSRRKKMLAHSAGRAAYAAIAFALVATFMAGCAGSTPTQSTTITVNATAGSQTVSAAVTVTIPN
jgi:hypothetical protein